MLRAQGWHHTNKALDGLRAIPLNLVALSFAPDVTDDPCARTCSSSVTHTCEELSVALTCDVLSSVLGCDDNGCCSTTALFSVHPLPPLPPPPAALGPSLLLGLPLATFAARDVLHLLGRHWRA